MRKRRGFTLFEVIIAMTIVIILISTMASTINVAFRLKRQAEESVAAMRDTYIVGDLFVIDVACIVPPNPLSADANSLAYQNAYAAATQAASTTETDETIVASGGIEGMGIGTGITAGTFYLFGAFTGSNTDLSFYTTGPEPRAAIQGDVRYVEYGLTQLSDGSWVLVRRTETNLLAEIVSANLPEEILVRNVASLSFQYFDGSAWSDNWSSGDVGAENTLPYAVKMTLKLNPVREGGEERTITRVATIWCSTKTVNDANAAIEADAAAAAEETTTGLGN